MYLEIVATITCIGAIGNLILQSYWFIWSRRIQERKHLTDNTNRKS